MHVASLELSKQLWELSGWGEIGTHSSRNPYFYWVDRSHDDREHELNYGGGSIPSDGDIYPAYDAGYLLRKLPSWVYDYPKKGDGLRFIAEHKRAGYIDDDNLYAIDSTADTPENALAKLSIELFKQKILTKEIE
jgi:hypothetical protein